MTKTMTAVLLALTAAAAHAADKPDIYLLIGQSNMAGRAPIEEVDRVEIPGAFLLNDKDTWEPIAHPLNRYSTIRKDIKMQRLNIGWTFAQAMRKANLSQPVGLVVNVKGGSSIEQWAAGQRFYTEAVRRTKAAQKAGTLRGVLWHQGESNSGKPDGYLGKLKDLVARLRKDLGAPKLLFVAGQIKQASDTESINQQIASLPQAVPGTGVATSEGLKVSDKWHFDSASTREFGRRYAASMLKLIAAEKR